MARLLLITMMCFCVFCAGCGIVSVLGSETPSEKRIDAEFSLKEHKGQKVLVFVDHTRASNASYVFQSQLELALNSYMVKKVRVPMKSMISSVVLDALKDLKTDFDSLSPVKIGSYAGADLVLYVLIEDYSLYQIPSRNYYTGSVATRSLLFDVSSGEIVWPASDSGRVIRAKVEMETGGSEIVVNRLTTALGHSITRYFYDCPQNKFRTMDEVEQIDQGW